MLQVEGLVGDRCLAFAMGDSILGTPEHPPVVAQLGAALEQRDAVCAIAVRELAVSPRYAMTSAIFPALRALKPGATGELELADAIAALLAAGAPVVALRLGDIASHDIGPHERYAPAFLCSRWSGKHAASHHDPPIAGQDEVRPQRSAEGLERCRWQQ